MEKEFVSYDLSLRMKQLGFDEPCLAWYVSESYGLEYGKVAKSDLIKDGIVAPTYSQVFRWFREKYNIHIRIEKYDETKWWANWGSWTSEVYDSYEKAELACLEKLIEIVEEKQK